MRNREEAGQLIINLLVFGRGVMLVARHTQDPSVRETLTSMAAAIFMVIKVVQHNHDL
jgi:hypothetical protein